MPFTPDDIAHTVLKAFEKLPAKAKPRPTENGRREWVPLAGIVLVKNGNIVGCLSLATGMKCLPHTSMKNCAGRVLHDCHAEVLAIRAFNSLLLQSILALSDELDRKGTIKSNSMLITRRSMGEMSPLHPQPFAIHDDVELHMYCSEAPCGDASMELTMQAQDDATPWPVSEAALKGRGNFSELGVVRRKPGRADAPPTHSKSCTDKLAMKQCTSLLSSHTSLFLSPGNAYLKSIVLPASQIKDTSMIRAFSGSGRMAPIVPLLGHFKHTGYGFHPFTISPTKREFQYSRRSAKDHETLVPSNLSAVRAGKIDEVIVNGALQGFKKGDFRGASKLSRQRQYDVAQESSFWYVGGPGAPNPRRALLTNHNVSRTYGAWKSDNAFRSRKELKTQVRDKALNGWIVNTGDDWWPKNEFKHDSNWEEGEEDLIFMAPENPRRVADVECVL